MYFKIPVNDGLLDVNYNKILEAHVPTEGTFAYVNMKEDTEVKETWISLTEDEFLAGFMAAFVTVDKMAILADGLDTAVLTVTSTMPEVNIYNDETADLVAIISIDPETNTGTLPITATDHGSIRLRAGLPLKSKVNQVEVFFSAI